MQNEALFKLDRFLTSCHTPGEELLQLLALLQGPAACWVFVISGLQGLDASAERGKITTKQLLSSLCLGNIDFLIYFPEKGKEKTDLLALFFRDFF